MNEINNKIKVIFIGTPDFGIPTIKALAQDERFEIIAVITQPDMPAGRQQIITPSPIKNIAQKYGWLILQPKKIKEITKQIKNLQPDIIIVIAYSQIIPEEILAIPKYGCINLHGSLLPKYRGAAVIQAAILNNEKETGLTIIKMDSKLDTGPILAQTTMPIDANDTYGSLYDKLANLAPDFFISTLIKYIYGKITPQKQDEAMASYVNQITKSDGLIDWNKKASEIKNLVNAMSPWPSAWTWWNGKQLKIISVQNKPIEINTYKPGKTFIYNRGLSIQCGQDALIINKLQLEGKKELTSQEFLSGQRDFIGNVLS
ncbi:MAG: methionyl-tRNA formyltransferase [Patescibacteria group bacterium]